MKSVSSSVATTQINHVSDDLLPLHLPLLIESRSPEVFSVGLNKHTFDRYCI